jgi:hypothetical protein
MSNHKIQILTIACAVTVALLAMPAVSMAQCYSCAAPVAVAAPACNTCVAPTFAYMPTPIYRTLYRPVAVYQPAVGCNTCTSYAYAAYRPVFPWTYHGRLVPYTTYQPVYSAVPVAAYSGCSPCAAYSSCSSCSPCGGCGVTTSGCSSCTAPATTVTAEPSTTTVPQTPLKTFSDKPVAEPEIKPVPQNDQNMKQMSAPALPDPRDRTTTRTVYTSARVAMVSSPAAVSAPADNDGWMPARD